MVDGSTVTALFKSFDKEALICDSSNLIKLNKFSVNELIVIREDALNLKEIEKVLQNQSEKVIKVSRVQIIMYNCQMFAFLGGGGDPGAGTCVLYTGGVGF